MTVDVLYNNSLTNQQRTILQTPMPLLKRSIRTMTFFKCVVVAPIGGVIITLVIMYILLPFIAAPYFPEQDLLHAMRLVCAGAMTLMLWMFILTYHGEKMRSLIPERGKYAKRSANLMVSSNNSYLFSITFALLSAEDAQKLGSNPPSLESMRLLFFRTSQRQFDPILFDEQMASSLGEYTTRRERFEASYEQLSAERDRCVEEFQAIYEQHIGPTPASYQQAYSRHLYDEAVNYGQTLSSAIAQLEDVIDSKRRMQTALRAREERYRTTFHM